MIAAHDARPRPLWSHVAAFIGLTFALTWLVDLSMYLRGGLQVPGALVGIQLQMLLPAFSAIVLGWRFFPESPLYYRRSVGNARWYYYYFLLLTAVYAAATAAIVRAPSASATANTFTLATQMAAFLGLAVLMVLRFVAGRPHMAAVGLSWVPVRYYALFGA
ncbi:MAG: hypothetical protein JO318_13295, partial [Chloroflexi bacterium]|nr:hypothetical protein [Chloroflexota bacterium]